MLGLEVLFAFHSTRRDRMWPVQWITIAFDHFTTLFTASSSFPALQLQMPNEICFFSLSFPLHFWLTADKCFYFYKKFTLIHLRLKWIIYYAWGQTKAKFTGTKKLKRQLKACISSSVTWQSTRRHTALFDSVIIATWQEFYFVFVYSSFCVT